MLKMLHSARKSQVAGMACLLCLQTASISPALATVLEYDRAGEVTVTETQTKNVISKTSIPAHPKANRLRELARTVAIQYAGSVGVRKAGLDAITFIEVFESLIQRESAFNSLAVSEKGTKGLGQLMPDTASEMGVNDPFDPHKNLIGSAKYFTQQLQRFGKLELALAAYNAGPERVKQYGGVPPFEETRANIDWIFKKAGIERTQQEDPASASLSKSGPKPKIVNIEAPLKGDVSVWEF
ncbi:MAG: transglycosylase SLT domain-containing protein [Rhodothermales bacterium]